MIVRYAPGIWAYEDYRPGSLVHIGGGVVLRNGDPDPYAQPDREVTRRAWDSDGEYAETYPVRVPPLFVVLGLPPPGPTVQLRPPETWAQGMSLGLTLVFSLLEIAAAFYWALWGVARVRS